MEFILDYFEWINIDRLPLLESYAVIDAATRKAGRPLGKNGLWIAASARSVGASILTTDRDFDYIHDLFVQRERIILPGIGPAATP